MKWQYFILIMMIASQALALTKYFGQSSESSSSNPLLEWLTYKDIKIKGNTFKIPFPGKAIVEKIESDNTDIDLSSLTGFTEFQEKQETELLDHIEESFLWKLASLHEFIKHLKGYKSSRFFNPDDIYYRWLLLYLVRQDNNFFDTRMKTLKARDFKHVVMKYSDFADKNKWAQKVVERLASIFRQDQGQQYPKVTQSLVKYLLKGERPQDAEAGSAVSSIHDLITAQDEKLAEKAM